MLQYDGWPKGLKIHRDGTIYLCDYKLGLLTPDPKTARLTTVAGTAYREGFNGLHDLHFANNGGLYFTNQGQAGIADPTGRVYRLAAIGRLDRLVSKRRRPIGLPSRNRSLALRQPHAPRPSDLLREPRSPTNDDHRLRGPGALDAPHHRVTVGRHSGRRPASTGSGFISLYPTASTYFYPRSHTSKSVHTPITPEKTASLIQTEEHSRFVKPALTHISLSDEAATTAAQLILQADLLGTHGHGIFRLPPSIRRIRAGGNNPRPTIAILNESAAAALVDGDNSLGHCVVSRATDLAITKARAQGVARVGSRNSKHAGPASLSVRRDAEQGQVATYFAVGSANHMAPWGGRDLLLSTNPLAIAVPSAAGIPVVPDMATTVAAHGKVKLAAKRGQTMPHGWMIDHHGQPLTDPQRASERLLLPISGYQGYGLALEIKLLAGALNGAAMGSTVIDFNSDDQTKTNTGQAIAVPNPGFFSDPASIAQHVERPTASRYPPH